MVALSMSIPTRFPRGPKSSTTPTGHLTALDAGFVRQIDIERIGVREVIEFHGRNLRIAAEWPTILRCSSRDSGVFVGNCWRRPRTHGVAHDVNMRTTAWRVRLLTRRRPRQNEASDAEFNPIVLELA